jgi:flagellar hook-length control protein FliK
MSITDQIAPTNLPGTGSAGGFFASLGGASPSADTASSLTIDFANAIETISAVEETSGTDLLSVELANSSTTTPSQIPTSTLQQTLGTLDSSTNTEAVDLHETRSLNNETFTELYAVNNTVSTSETTTTVALPEYIEANGIAANNQTTHILSPDAFREFEQIAYSYNFRTTDTAIPSSNIDTNSLANPLIGTSISSSIANTHPTDSFTLENFLEIAAQHRGETSPQSADITAPTQSSGTLNSENASKVTPLQQPTPHATNEANNTANNTDIEAILEQARVTTVSDPVVANIDTSTNAQNTSTIAGTTTLPQQSGVILEASTDQTRQTAANSQVDPSTTSAANQQQADGDSQSSGQRGSTNSQSQFSAIKANTESNEKNSENFGTEIQVKATEVNVKRANTAQTAPQTSNSAQQTITPVITDTLPSLAYERFLTSSLQSSFGSLINKDNNVFGSSELFGGKPNSALASQVKNQFNLAVSKAASGGEQEFTVRLNPGDLGRVNVRLQFAENGNLRAQVAVENPETLELLQRDAKGFERALEASGHKTEQNGISFSLDDSNKESAGRALAEALQQEKIRDELAARPDSFAPQVDTEITATKGEEIPLEDILPYVSVDTGLDIRI